MAKKTYTKTKKKADTTRGSKQNEKPTESFNPDLAGIPDYFEEGFFDDLVKQVNAEYTLAYDNQEPSLKEDMSRLKVYNNQKRDKNAVGDPLLFTVQQTVLASLYDDELMPEFEGRDEGDEETGGNLESLAKYDHDLMGKDELDYFWMWDTLFFARGIVRMYEFDRDERFMCPIPELYDPMTFLHDPKATSVNGDIKGRGAMRFGGREVEIEKIDITEGNGYFNFENLDLDGEVKSLIKEAQDLKDEAQNRNQTKNKSDEVLGDNALVPCLEWRTRYKGKKCIVWLANGRKRPIKYIEIGDAKKEKWDLVDRPMYPTSREWRGTSVPDLVEDKQRQRAVMINLGIQSIKSDLYPMYLFDEDKVKNKGDLMNFGFNKFVPIQGGGDVRGAVQPMNKASPRMDLVNFILETLDVSAQRATATPEMQQGSISSEKRTLGELNLVASKVDTRYSLTAKVFGWSEREFWNRWYHLYKKHFKDDIDEKVIRIKGSYGTKWRPLTRENIIMVKDPDVAIESKVVSENNKLKRRILLNQFGNAVMADPNSNKAFFMRKLATLNGLDEGDVERLYPPTLDEMIAERENDMLSEDKLAQVSVNDDDLVHMEVHAKAAETKAKAAHIQAHLDAMMIKRAQPELFQSGQLNEAEAVNPQNAPVNTQAGNQPNPQAALNATPSEQANPNNLVGQ